MNPYEILGLADNSSVDEINDRYNIMSRQIRSQNYGQSPLDNAAKARLAELDAAYNFLIYDIPMPSEHDLATNHAIPVQATNPDVRL